MRLGFRWRGPMRAADAQTGRPYSNHFPVRMGSIHSFALSNNTMTSDFNFGKWLIRMLHKISTDKLSYP
jgi:hypothetical protein